MLLVVVAALALTCVHAYTPIPPVLPANIQPSELRPAEHAYVASIYVGSPAESMTMEVRFDVAGIWIYRQQDTHSAGHIIDDGGEESDIVYLGSVRQRMPVHDNARSRPPLLTEPPHLLCGTCDGILGLRGDSDIWQWWSDASFTPATITLGALSRPLRAAHHTEAAVHTWEVPCENHDGEPNLCVISVTWRGERYRAIVSPSSPYTLAPRHVVREYLSGKNLYDNTPWDFFVLVLPDATPFDGSDEKPHNLSIAFDRDDLSGQHGSESLEMLLDVYDKGGRNDTFVLGSTLLKRLVVYRTGDRERIIVHAHPVFTGLPIAHSLLFLVLFIFYVRWKMTDIGRHYARVPRRLRVNVVDVVYQALGWTISFTAIFLPDTWVVMQDVPFLHALAGVAIGLGILVELFSRYILWNIQKLGDSMRATPRSTPHMFLLLLTESVWHETVLATGMWLLVVPRRKEGLAGPITTLIAGVSVYSITVHAMLYIYFCLAYLAPGLNKKVAHRMKLQRPASTFKWLVSVAGISLALTAALFIYLLVWVFALPVVENISAIYSELAPAAVTTLSLLAVVVGIVLADAFLEHTARTTLKQRIEDAKSETPRPRGGQDDEHDKVVNIEKLPLLQRR